MNICILHSFFRCLNQGNYYFVFIEDIINLSLSIPLSTMATSYCLWRSGGRRDRRGFSTESTFSCFRRAFIKCESCWNWSSKDIASLKINEFLIQLYVQKEISHPTAAASRFLMGSKFGCTL